MSKKYAFTLAEVLISLVIIGVIAAITVPVLLQKYQEQALKSALKKNYSVLKSALDKYQVDNGERLLSSDSPNWGKLKKILMKYLNVTKDCNSGQTDTSCVSNYNKVYKTYNNKNYIDLRYFDDGQFIINDGGLIMIENQGNSMTLYISIDVNGYQKKPNQLGKDLFMFQLMGNGELLPMGAKGTTYYNVNNAYCSNTSTHNMNGAGCTAKVLRD
jgi:prepilin-type N-terminal cleavage/methylation domain-containing protein